ncbi:MAG: chemotaxis protein CheA [Nitrospinae bacterium]|nr:chemotaxis protein CheA [Nitrospinota bacterium]
MQETLNMMMDGIDKEILDEFIKETMEELDGLDAQFISLEKNPKDSDVINSIFRTVHSIKGSASFFNLNHIRNFAHKFENLLDELRKGKRTVTSEIVDLLLKGKDCLDGMFKRLAAGDLSGDLKDEESHALAVVERILASADEAEKPTPQVLFQRILDMRRVLAEDGLLQRPSVTALFALVEELKLAVLGDEAKEEGVVPKLGEILVEQGVISHKDVAEALSSQKRLGDILVEQGKVTPEAIQQAAELQRKKTEDTVAEKVSKEAEKVTEKKAGIRKTMRIEEEKIDGFMALVGELIINAEVFNYLQKKIELGVDPGKIASEFKNANLEFNELTFKLQRGLAEVRKVSINGIFQKLPRMVRDLANSTGKQVDFSMAGEDLLIDKSLFEQLEAPMNHIIRNAVDHGLEPPTERVAVDKDPIGKVFVKAEEDGGDLVITVKDDGRGLDANRLRAKAVEKGIISQAAAELMPDREAYRLIFAAGFSTAQKITDVSGRGVGMDVVITAVKEAKGKVDIDTDLGNGTTFLITMPMSNTLITISGLLVAVGKESYIIPMEWVRESLKPARGQISSVKRAGEVVEIRNTLYPLLRLHNVFGVKPKFTDPWDGVVMVLDKDGQRCCLMVDEIVEETQVVLKDLGKTFRNIKGILGGAILGDGRVGLVLNVEGLMQEGMVV